MGLFDDDDDKTERATPRKRQEAREKGQVAQSKELMASLMLFAGLAGLLLFGGKIGNSVGAVTVRSFRRLANFGTEQLDVESSAALIVGAAGAAAAAVGPILVVMIVVGLVVGLGQVGLQLSPKALELSWNKLNPISGMSKLFGMRGMVRTALALGKILVILGVMSLMAWSQTDEAASLTGVELGPLMAGTGHVLLRCVIGGLLAIFIMAIIDFAYQRFQHERDLRMSKKEVKDESRNSEGDPRVKARIRKVQRELAMQRMMEAVPKATVVVTNPTHYAVALKYERPAAGDDSPPAPRVVAKGVDHVARRIRELATESDVPLFEDPPLARALYAQVEIGDEIPMELYEAVASVLAYVYRVQGMAATA